MPNRATMNQPSSPHMSVDRLLQLLYISQPAFGSLMVPTINKEPDCENQRTSQHNHSCRISIFKHQSTFSVIFFSSFFLFFFFSCDRTNRTLVGSNVTHRKQERQSQRKRSDWSYSRAHISKLGFKGNETEMSAWDSVTYSTAGAPSMTVL